MEIKVKFKEGDTLWFIHNTKAIETIIRGIKIDRRQLVDSDDVVQEITYLCSKVNKEPRVYLKVDETVAYPTKDALIQSL